jgi:hypothetical protein
MEVTTLTGIVAVAGMLSMACLGRLQLTAALRPRGSWVIENVYGGSSESTDSKAYFALNQGIDWAETIFWAACSLPAALECCSAFVRDSCTRWSRRSRSGTAQYRCSSGIASRVSGRTRRCQSFCNE